MYRVNSSSFDKLDINNAWLLGLIYSDGNITRSTYTTKNGEIRTYFRLTFHMHKDDEDVMIKANKILDSDYPIRTDKRGYVYMSISSELLCNKIISFGCCPAKSKILEYPTFISEDLESHFIRGLFDGDGCMGIQKKMTSGTLSIVGTKSICDGIYYALKKRGIYSYIYNQPKTESWYIKIGRRTEILKFIDYLYKDSNIENRMNRKYDSCLRAKDRIMRTLSNSEEDTYIFNDAI